MATDHNSANPPEPPQPGFLARTLFSTDHKAIGLNYLWLALFSVFLGLAMSLLMRIHLVWPAVRLPFLGGDGLSLERYAALTTLHGSLMVFLVLTAAPQAGFGNYFLPLQIGAREMAFPKLNRLAFWATAASLLGLTAAFLAAPQTGITLWIVSVALFSAAALCNGINFSVTTHRPARRRNDLAAPPAHRLGLVHQRNSQHADLQHSPRRLRLPAFRSSRKHTLFSRLQFSLQPAARISRPTHCPCSGSASSGFSRKPKSTSPCSRASDSSRISSPRFPASPFGWSASWFSRLCAVGLFGFCVWGQHMFASGMNPFSPLVFSLLASSLGLPAVILLISWLGTLWNARIQLNTSMLFAIGFVSLFMAGGLSGIFLARRDLAAAAVSDDFVTGHFHLVMGVAATFAILGALFFWFPKLFGRRLNEPLGKIHFWLTFAGVYLVFMPMHWLGLLAHANIYSGQPPCRHHRNNRAHPRIHHRRRNRLWSLRKEFFSSIFSGVFSVAKKRTSAIPGAPPPSNGASPPRRPPMILAPPTRWCIVGHTNSACPASPKISSRSTWRQTK